MQPFLLFSIFMLYLHAWDFKNKQQIHCALFFETQTYRYILPNFCKNFFVRPTQNLNLFAILLCVYFSKHAMYSYNTLHGFEKSCAQQYAKCILSKNMLTKSFAWKNIQHFVVLICLLKIKKYWPLYCTFLKILINKLKRQNVSPFINI